MKKFVVIYYASIPADKMQGDPKEMKGVMDAWMAWAKRCGDGIVDLGTPLSNGQIVTKTGGSASKGNVVGYSILQAESMEKAKAMLAGHPHLMMPGQCDIEVHECMPLPL